MSENAPNSSQDAPTFDVPSIEEMTAYLPQFRFEKLAACGGMGEIGRAHV